MEKFGVLIIEDNSEHYRRIKYEILPSNCFSILDLKPTEFDLSEKELNLSEDEINAINIFKDTSEASLKRSVNYVVKDIIPRYQDCLRLIICDLRINGNNEGGKQLIKAINIDRKNWFAQQIPILILSGMTDEIKAKAVLESMGRCMHFTKETAFQSIDIINDVISYMVNDFDGKCKKQKYEKSYKVALSFTGFTTDENGIEMDLSGFIEEIAHKLYYKYGRDKVFYHPEKRSETASLTPKQLAKNYNNSEFTVVFLSKNYVNKVSEWATEEWEIIQKLVFEKRVLFMKLDSSVKSKVFEEKLGISNLSYTDLTRHCSKYYEVVEGKDEGYKDCLVDYFLTKSLSAFAVFAINKYKYLIKDGNEVDQAAKEIIDAISVKIKERK